MKGTNSRARAALIAVALILLSLKYSWLAWFLPAFALLIAFFGSHEVYSMARHKGIPCTAIVVIGAVILTLSGLLPGGGFIWFLIPQLVILLFGAFVYHVSKNGVDGSFTAVPVNFFGAIYVGLPLAMGLQILGFDKLFFLLVLLIVWSVDSGAYYAGRKFGKHKLAPSVSPGKTWEGVVGGVAAAIAVTLLFCSVVPKGKGFGFAAWELLLVALVVTFFATLGDLSESALKRDAGVKDSGISLTGHGGVLDRIDSLLFALPIAYLYLMFSGRFSVFERVLTMP